MQIWDLLYYRNYLSSTSQHKNQDIFSNLKVVHDYHSIKMKSMFEEPIPIIHNDRWDYLKTYGGFYIHCGILAMGAPNLNLGDDHPLHGELPNVKFNKCYINIDEKENKLSIIGEYINKKQFDYHYKFISNHSIMLNSNRDSSNNNKSKKVNENIENNLINTSCTIENYYHKDLKAMYLAHINFRPEYSSELIYSAPCTKDTINLRSEIPAHIKASEKYLQFVPKLVKEPTLHHYLNEELMSILDTEVVLTLNDYHSVYDEWAISMQKLNEKECHDNGSYIVLHKPQQLKKSS